MKIRPAVLLCVTGAASALTAFAQAPAPAQAQPAAGRGGGQQPMPPGPNPNSQYRLGPDSMPQEGVPKGEIRGPFVIPSSVYPGTERLRCRIHVLFESPGHPGSIPVEERQPGQPLLRDHFAG